MNHDPAFTFTYAARLTDAWCNFEINDTQLLVFSVNAPIWYQQQGMFIASLNNRSQLRELLEACGMAIERLRVVDFVFRTSNPVVDDWAYHWGARIFSKPGHRNRYLLRQPGSGVFYELVNRAHQLRCVNALRKCKWN